MQHAPRNEISIDELSSLITEGDNIAIIDVRETWEWDAGHIEGIRHISLGDIPAHIPELLTFNTIVFICRSGARSRKACDMLSGAGHAHTLNVRGGMNAWEARR